MVGHPQLECKLHEGRGPAHFLVTAHCKMRGKGPLKWKANAVLGIFIKMSGTMVFWCVSRRKEGNGVGSPGVERLRNDIPALLFKVLLGAFQRRGVEFPERCSGRRGKGRKLRGRFGFQVLLIVIVE